MSFEAMEGAVIEEVHLIIQLDSVGFVIQQNCMNLAILYIYTLFFFYSKTKYSLSLFFKYNLFFLNLVAFSINVYCFHLILLFSHFKPSNLGFRAYRSHAV